MKKRIAFALLICLPGSVLPLESHAVATGQPDPRKQEPAIVYQIMSQGKVMKMATQMPLMHRASISPSGRYLYGERIGYGKNDRTTPFLYNMQTKKLTTLSGFAKWSPAQDLLYIKENGALVRVNPSDGKKKC